VSPRRLDAPAVNPADRATDRPGLARSDRPHARQAQDVTDGLCATGIGSLLQLPMLHSKSPSTVRAIVVNIHGQRAAPKPPVAAGAARCWNPARRGAGGGRSRPAVLLEPRTSRRTTPALRGAELGGARPEAPRSGRALTRSGRVLTRSGRVPTRSGRVHAPCWPASARFIACADALRAPGRSRPFLAERPRDASKTGSGQAPIAVCPGAPANSTTTCQVSCWPSLWGPRRATRQVVYCRDCAWPR
jgi:hypothetical protein